VLAFLERLDEQPAAPTVLVVTHSAEVASRAERVVAIHEGRITGAELRAGS